MVVISIQKPQAKAGEGVRLEAGFATLPELTKRSAGVPEIRAFVEDLRVHCVGRQIDLTRLSDGSPVYVNLFEELCVAKRLEHAGHFFLP